jgi:hypothetical protein
MKQAANRSCSMPVSCKLTQKAETIFSSKVPVDFSSDWTALFSRRVNSLRLVLIKLRIMGRGNMRNGEEFGLIYETE